MEHPVHDLATLLSSLDPERHDGVYVYTLVHGSAPPVDAIATFREKEGLTLIVEERQALAAGLPILFRAAWITLTVTSDLQAVGLTAAVAGALTAAGISCNVMAGARHDHLFVPVERAEEALAALRALGQP
ncbi:ACT domain-containing protein [Mesoterricola silvestris]|nr:ACT domain-containing protein [Mesoterricola silvestris]